MRLPSHVLILVAATIGCEQAERVEPNEPPPTAVERADESLADAFHVTPAVAPRFTQPQQQQQPQPQPQPQIKQKPKRPVQASVCGHPVPADMNPSMKLARCGRG